MKTKNEKLNKRVGMKRKKAFALSLMVLMITLSVGSIIKKKNYIEKNFVDYQVAAMQDSNMITTKIPGFSGSYLNAEMNDLYTRLDRVNISNSDLELGNLTKTSNSLEMVEIYSQVSEITLNNKMLELGRFISASPVNVYNTLKNVTLENESLELGTDDPTFLYFDGLNANNLYSAINEVQLGRDQLELGTNQPDFNQSLVLAELPVIHERINSIAISNTKLELGNGKTEIGNINSDRVYFSCSFYDFDLTEVYRSIEKIKVNYNCLEIGQSAGA